MNREQLKELQLDGDQINSIMSMYGKSTQALQSEITEKETALNELQTAKATLESEKSALETKAQKLETVQSEIDELKTKNAELSNELSNNELDKRILKVISKDAHDPDDIFKFVNKDDFEYDEETGDITNFDDVINSVKESKPYLFSTPPEEKEPQVEDKKNNGNYSTNKQQGNEKDKPNYDEVGKDLVAQLYGKQED